MAILLPVKATADDKSLRRAGETAEKFFLNAGKTSGDAFNKSLSGALDDTTKVLNKASRDWERAYDRAADAAGRVAKEQAKLDALGNDSSRSQRIAQSERLAKAQRDEARAVRESVQDYREYADAIRRVQNAQISNTSLSRAFGVGNMGRMGTSAAQSFVSAFGGFLLAGGLLNVAQAAGRQFADGFQAVLDTGLNFDRTVNSFRGVTQATEAEMQRMQAAARALGSDTQLAGVSAQDAATAMTELAKGGFSVEQSMEAARGTLQLATAAQISAADAAKIQTNAINVFQLKTQDAAHVADVFANAANASAVEIPELSLALQQAGSVAAGFGISFEDTVATLDTFAQLGVKGSDAGTLMKTSLLAWQSPSDQQAQAMQALNLQLSDAQGNFVGYREMMAQLTDASRSMTQEQFNNAAATLFGTDAVRAAMFAANDAAPIWDQQRQALERTGSASELAAAQMHGLPGVVESVKNSIEGVKLGIYDGLGPIAEQVGPQIVKAFDDLNNWISTHKAEIVNFFGEVGHAAIVMGEIIAAQASITAGTFAMIAQALGTSANLVGEYFQKLAEPLQKVPDFLLGPGLKAVKEFGEAGGKKLQDFGAEATRAAKNLEEFGKGAGNMATSVLPGWSSRLDEIVEKTNKSIGANNDLAGSMHVLGGAVGAASSALQYQGAMLDWINKIKSGQPAGPMPTYSGGNPLAGGGAAASTPWGVRPDRSTLAPTPTPKSEAEKGKKEGQRDPAVPFGDLPPVQPGVPITSEVYSAQTALWKANQDLEEKKAKVLQVQADNNHTEQELLAAKNDVAEAERRQTEAEMRFADAQKNAYEQQYKQMTKAAGNLSKTADDLGQIGAALDKDFGLSKGLPGLADNLVRFIGNIAAAPLLGPLNAISAAQGGIDKTGSGLMGMLGAAGAFGPEFMDWSGVGMPGFSSGLSQSGSTAMVSPSQIGMPSILQDTGKVASGPQSRYASALIEQMWGSQLRGKIGGSRDNNTAPNTHDKGLSIDIPIGPDQMALGDEINAWLQSHAQELGLKYSIWRDKGQNVGGGTFNQPGHQNHIDAHFNGDPSQMQAIAQGNGGMQLASMSGATPVYVVNMPGGGLGFGGPTDKDGNPTGKPAGMDSASMSDPGQIAQMIFGMATQRGYSKHDAQSIVAYALGESSLDPKRSGGTQPAPGQSGDAYADNVMGLFQQKPAFAQAGGIDPSQRSDPYYNTLAYLNQLEKNRGLPIEQALPATSVGGPLAKGGEQPWGPLMDRAGNLLGLNYGGQPQLHDAGANGPGIPPGTTVVQNNTGKPEAVIRPDQMAKPADIMAPNIAGNMSAGGPVPGPAPTPGQQGPSQIGGAEPDAQNGSSVGGGGGLFGAGIGAAAMAADSFAPGSGAAVQIAGQEIQRAIKAGGQAAGIGVEALMETFLPTGASEIANDNWFSRIAGGFVGLGPQLPNMAGKAPTPVPQQQAPAPMTIPAPPTDPSASRSQPNNVTLNINGVQNVDQSTANMLKATTDNAVKSATLGPGQR